MNPLFKKNDINLFKKYINQSKVYFEYGCGGSTYLASLCDNIQKIYTVESDIEWLNKVKFNINIKKDITYIYNEMDTKPNTYGIPGKNATDIQKIEYSNKFIRTLPNNVDTILIDGRFRVACVLKLYPYINEDTIIIFDDFLDRSYYHNIILNYFNLIDYTSDKSMAVLQKKINLDIPKSLIQKYELLKNKKTSSHSIIEDF
tara:strand:- start:2216 stop:2821 length:606 start_codon:yes stop_codon:yes gene_type:complete